MITYGVFVRNVLGVDYLLFCYIRLIIFVYRRITGGKGGGGGGVEGRIYYLLRLSSSMWGSYI